PTYSSELLDETGEKIDPYIMDPYPIKKQFTFALDNNNRRGATGCVCVLTDDRSQEERNEDRHWKYPGMFVKTKIHLTKVTGVRRNALFDHTSPSMLSDTTLIVEEKKLHVNKQYLSNISTVFSRMFNEASPECNNRYVLNGVKYQDCLEFPRWIYPSPIKNFEERDFSCTFFQKTECLFQFIIDQIAAALNPISSCGDRFLGLRMILHFGFDVDLQVRINVDIYIIDRISSKLNSEEDYNTAAYREMDSDNAREMLDYLANKLIN
ncbi:hypothetical protein PMAYCL1PPCAC_25716, partial [Pristionchus mayeri]